MARIISAELNESSPSTHDLTDSGLDRSFGIFKGPPCYTAEILFTGTAAELVKHQVWHKDQEMTEVEEGTILKLPVHDDREIMMKILQYGHLAKVIKPKKLALNVYAEIAKAINLYDKP